MGIALGDLICVDREVAQGEDVHSVHKFHLWAVEVDSTGWSWDWKLGDREVWGKRTSVSGDLCAVH